MERRLNVDGIEYEVLDEPEQIEGYVLRVADEEWDPEDFDDFGADLHGKSWSLERVAVARVRPQNTLLASPEFQADVQPRIAAQRCMHRRGEAIPPLILRGADLLIFDGYARWHLFRELGISTCLAYVGRTRGTGGS
ncbi:MAG: hypothetical protein V2J24_01455 [Pseudomonadales bacterium]|jgi:hypothetical protein|nr:hypothetical protein [Pseudomonadales bacterium]